MDLGKIRTPSLALGLILALAATGPAHAQKRGPQEHRSPMLLVFAHALWRHIGAYEQISGGAIFGLDLVGDIENVGQRNLVADQPLIKRAELLLRNFMRDDGH